MYGRRGARCQPTGQSCSRRPGYGGQMSQPEEPEDYEELMEQGRRFHDLTWSLVGNELPDEVWPRILGPVRRLGEPDELPAESNRRSDRIMNVYEGLLAAQYHRDHIERIEVELVRRLREAYPEGSRPGGGSAAMRMPVVGHEYVAYLFAARRTLDYLAQAVSVLFGRWVHSIKNLATDLQYGKPDDLAAKAAKISGDVTARFPELLTGPGEPRSERDEAAHFSPVEPAQLSVIFFPDGRVGIELHDMGPGLLPSLVTLDPERMSRDEPMLTQAIDARLADLHDFCAELIDLAIQAEERRLGGTGDET
jgi:hypothetical protein